MDSSVAVVNGGKQKWVPKIKVAPIVGQKWVPKIHQPTRDQIEANQIEKCMMKDFSEVLSSMNSVFEYLCYPNNEEIKKYKKEHKDMSTQVIAEHLQFKEMKKLINYKNKALILFWKAIEFPEFFHIDDTHLGIVCMMIYIKQSSDWSFWNSDLISIFPTIPTETLSRTEFQVIGTMWEYL
jgi:hypothetical protein